MFLFRLMTLVLLFLSSATYSQQPTPKTLLWRITGKNLSRPSYLFGTMHLSDKRIFNFTDSVYAAIDNTDGLAIELSPDEMGLYYANQIFEDIENKRTVREMLSTADYEKYNKGLSKKFRKPADKITTSDILSEKNKWISQYMEKGEMPTFVDAYLYNIARRKGKWLGGIEDMADQANLLDDMVDKSDIEYLLLTESDKNPETGKSMMEHLINVYMSQDLDAINHISDGGTAEEKDRLLIRRNLKMARRIDSLANIRSMFSAIGAAHLPGDSGVIDLLRKRGFTVEPVMSNRKIAAADYKFKEITIPWVEVKDEQAFYSIQMPGNPASVKMHGLIDVKFHLDLFQMTCYSTMASVSPGGAGRDSIIYNLAKNIFKGKKVKPLRQVSQTYASGQEFFYQQDKGFIRIQILVQDNIFYMAFMTAMKKELLFGENADRFFDALKIPEKKSLRLTNAGDYFRDTISGFGFKTSARMSKNLQLGKNDADWITNTYSGTDAGTGSYIMLMSREIKAGRYLPSDSLLFAETVSALAGQYRMLSKESYELGGRHVFEFTGANNQQAGLYIRYLTTVSGNRNITLMTVSDSNSLFSDQTKSMFSSLSFVPGASAAWKSVTSPDNGFVTHAPAAFQREDSMTRDFQFISYDKHSATSYFVIPDTLGKYFWAASDTAFWNPVVKGQAFDNILVEDKTNRAALKTARDLVFRKNTTGNIYSRVKLVLSGNILYKLFVSGSKDQVYSENTERFFNEFVVTNASVSDDFIYQSKATKLIHDLGNDIDSSTRVLAVEGLEQANFDPQDYQLLTAVLFKSYRSVYSSDTSAYVNRLIAAQLIKMDKPATLAFIKEQYFLLKSTDDELKKNALVTLAKIRTTDSYNLLASLMKQPLTEPVSFYQLGSDMTDSLQLCAGIFDKLLTDADFATYNDVLAGLAINLLDSNHISLKQCLSAEQAFIKVADDRFNSIMKNPEEFSSGVYNSLQLFQKMGTTVSNAMLKKYQDVKSLYIANDAVAHLLTNKQEVSQPVLNRIAADTSLRPELYRALKKAGKLSLFPKAYRKQSLFALSAIYNAASDDDEPSLIRFVGIHKKKINGKLRSFYCYEIGFDYGDEVSRYLGIAGPFDGPDDLVSADDMSGLYWGEPFDASEIGKQLENFIAGQSSDNWTP